jgi:glycosyltransferase involved in cell wall biosynthesis
LDAEFVDNLTRSALVAEARNGNSAIDRPGRVAIVHDYLTQKGGAERVVLAMHRAFPEAPIYTSLYEPDLTFPEFRNIDVRPSYLNRSRFLRRRHRLSLPFLAHAFSNMEIDEEIVLCSSSGWAHGVQTAGTKLVYCHCPARWLYKRADYFRKNPDLEADKPGLASLSGIHATFIARNAFRLVTPFLRRWDRRAALSASEYYANSDSVSAEVSAVYGIDPLVIHPSPSPFDGRQWEKPPTFAKEGFFLVVSRLLPYKNLDRILEVFAHRLDQELVVVGAGPLGKTLRQSAPSNVDFIGNVSDHELSWLYGNCRALIAPAYEDYGLTPLEAASFGKPTLALRRGGYLETVSESTSGYYFDDLEPSSISRAFDVLFAEPLDPDEIRAHAASFSEEKFARTLREHVASHLSY